MTIDGITLTGEPLSVEAIVAVSRGDATVSISPDADAALDRARSVVEQACGGDRAVYGVNTGFGALSSTRIAADQLETLQLNLIRSHAAGVGQPLPTEVVRGTMLLLAASLCRGHSGVRPRIPHTLVGMLNAGVTPVVPSRGSVGASGDLAPLAHLALALCGEGEACLGSKRMPGTAAMAAAGLEPIVPSAKDGLALINGTHVMAAIAALALADIAVIKDAALLAAAMAIDAAMATDAVLDAQLHKARGQSGQQVVAQRLAAHLAGSTIVPSHATDDPRVQDPYSLRCAPQVLGAAFDAIDAASVPIIAELGAVTDNPLVFVDEGRILSGGNFHGMPLAISMDAIRTALCHVAGISERRVEWVLSARDPRNGLPPFLAGEPGYESGLMIAQYTAAACCAEMRTLAMPASVSNISTSAGIEDYNSMGATAGLMLRQSVDLCRNVIAVEFLVMAEAVDCHRPLRSGDAVEAAHEQIRASVPKRSGDRPPGPDIELIAAMLGDLVA